MNQEKLQQLDANELRIRLGDAERKYYANLHDLQEQLTRVKAVQELSNFLIGFAEPDSAFDKLVELSLRDFGVEKAIVLEPRDTGYAVAAMSGYSRRRTKELAENY